MDRVLHADRIRTYHVSYEAAAKAFVDARPELTFDGVARAWVLDNVPISVASLDFQARVVLYEKMQTVLKFALIREMADFSTQEEVRYAKLVDTFARHLEASGAMSTLGASAEDLITSAIMFFHYACFFACGRKVYSVSEGLTQELLHTQIKGLDTDNLRLPLTCFYVEVPMNSGLEIFNRESGWHRLEGFYITEDTKPDIAYQGCRRWRILLVGEPKPVMVKGTVFDNDALAHFWIDMQPGKLDAALAVAHTKFISTFTDFRHQMESKWLEFFEFAVNVVLYITMPGSELEEIIPDKAARDLFNRWQKCPKGKKKAKLKERLKGANTQRVTLVGKSIVFDRRLKEAAEERRGTGTSRVLRLRFLRSGHFRMQPYGPGREERRRIWIQPHWVGGADLPITSSTKVDVRLPDEGRDG